MVRIGIAGIGFMGMIHYLAAQKLASAKVVSLCSRDPKKRAGDWTSIRGNFGPQGTQMDLSGQALYAEASDLFADPNVDLVDLCVPNDEHARLAILALEAGKHVLVEKPIALTVADADRMLDAAGSNGKLLMVAHVLPFFPEFAFALATIQSERYGKLQAAHFERVISKPDWSSGISDSDRSGGPAIDLHIHDTHFIGLACGVPRAVRSRGVRDGSAVVYLSTQYLYDDPDLAVSAMSGALSQSGRPFTHGYSLFLEGATLTFSFANVAGEGRVQPLSVILPNGSVESPALGSGDPINAFARELAVAADAVAANVDPPSLSGNLARQALAICRAEVESVWTDNTIEIN
jgi:predicted dehydrogenase